ncbi:MAG TPA: SpoIIE family protein phosphatase [Candidatus Omnitrophota bacterium]|nr:SpoIIE family protein phosphatase [Candidatus Omnitrophota bacterium]HRZ15417.1 SpoIIE family protein phosphatase [Candidatus Omnitrophota bacterium]
MKIRSLAVKFILYVSGCCVVILLAIIGFNYRFSEGIIMAKIRENAENLALRTVNKIEIELASVKKTADTVADYLEEGAVSKERIERLLKLVVVNNKELYGMGIAFEPYAFDPKSLYFCPYYAKEKSGLVLYNLGAEAYRYFTLDWYQIPRELGRAVWTEPYFDDVLMASYSVPFYQASAQGRKLKGIVNADISLQWLTDIVSSVKIFKTGDAYLISRNGMIITHPLKELIMNETVFSVAESRNDPALREIGRRMVRGESGFVPFTSLARNKKSWMYYAPVPSTGWTLAVVFPQDELFEDIRRQTALTGAMAGAGIIFLVLVIALLAHSITKPLRLISRAAHSIGEGNFDAKLPAVDSADEVGRLSRAFGNMQSALKEYIKRLTETTAAKERIESELKIAHEIQTGILPRIFPAFPDRKEFDIYAMMEPAKEVGGDFYDFCLIDEKRLFFVMGDVSGKGVPAALFMMITKTLLKNEALQGLAAHEILYKVNNILALDNTATMFATVFCGILDTATGEVEFANAGHNPPLVSLDGRPFEFLTVDKGFVLGPMQNFKFTSRKLNLGHGDTIFLYTDGVTEAMDPEKRLFSEQRLQDALSRLGRDKYLVEMIRTVREEVSVFVRNAPQSDDITMLILRFN